MRGSAPSTGGSRSLAPGQDAHGQAGAKSGEGALQRLPHETNPPVAEADDLRDRIADDEKQDGGDRHRSGEEENRQKTGDEKERRRRYAGPLLLFGEGLKMLEEPPVHPGSETGRPRE